MNGKKEKKKRKKKKIAVIRTIDLSVLIYPLKKERLPKLI